MAMAITGVGGSGPCVATIELQIATNDFDLSTRARAERSAMSLPVLPSTPTRLIQIVLAVLAALALVEHRKFLWSLGLLLLERLGIRP